MEFAEEDESRKKYKLRPKIGERIKPLEVKLIISEILKDQLKDVKIIGNVPEKSKKLGKLIKNRLR
jgi:hypothetical protein